MIQIFPLRRPKRVPIQTASDWDLARQEQTHRLRGRYGLALLAVLIIQLIAADALMGAYAYWGVNWKIPNAVMQTWLGATVVQLIGLVYVVVSHLFPKPPLIVASATTPTTAATATGG